MCPQGRRRAARRLQSSIESNPVPLVVVGPTAVCRDIEIILRRAEKELAQVVNCFRERIGKTVAAPGDWPLYPADRQAIVVGVADGFVL